MDEAEVLALLDPETSTKRGEAGQLGGFGVGFFSMLAEAHSARVVTAKKGSPYVYEVFFTVERDVDAGFSAWGLASPPRTLLAIIYCHIFKQVYNTKR